MENNINYPVKYAVLKLESDGGYYYKFKDLIRGFIVSKCFITSSVVNFNQDGSNTKYYKVVFPFKDIDKYEEKRLNKMALPSYLIDNTDIVYEIYDSYKEAKSVANKKNLEILYEIRNGITSNFPYYKDCYFNNEEEKTKDAILDKMIICENFENFISENTENINVSDINVKSYKL